MHLLIRFTKWKYLEESTRGQLSKDHFAVIHHSVVIHEALRENFHSHSRIHYPSHCAMCTAEAQMCFCSSAVNGLNTHNHKGAWNSSQHYFKWRNTTENEETAATQHSKRVKRKWKPISSQKYLRKNIHLLDSPHYLAVELDTFKFKYKPHRNKRGF